MEKLASTSVGDYSPQTDCKILFNLLSFALPDSKRRSKLKLVRNCLIEIREWTEKQESRKPEVKALLQLLDRDVSKKALSSGARSKARRKFLVNVMSKSKKAI